MTTDASQGGAALSAEERAELRALSAEERAELRALCERAGDMDAEWARSGMSDGRWIAAPRQMVEALAADVPRLLDAIEQRDEVLRGFVRFATDGIAPDWYVELVQQARDLTAAPPEKHPSPSGEAA